MLVEVNDTGIDAAHPDFSAGRVTGLPASLVDVNGHGTHVAGIIAGNGSESSTINTTNTPQGSVTNADFRGKAPLAKLYSFAALDNTGNQDISDQVLQEVPATNNALISNNSWVYDDSTYDLAAASYDAAVRDALPLITGSQPVLFVFAAGNDGGGDDSGGGGFPDSILSPGTAKDVITVGALEQLRNITNMVTDANGNSNAVWQAATDSGNEVAGYSSRGNVGIGTEGSFGRFKPDVVAPGSFVVSTRSAQWDTNAYYNPTNVTFNDFSQQVVDPNTLNYYPVTVPANAVGVTILIVPNASSSSPFPTNLPIYVAESGFPTTTVNDGVTFKNEFDIPADATPGFLPAVQNGGFNFAVGNTSSTRVNYDVLVEITTTNDMGNYFQVLEGLNETLAPFYRYETGTSMSTPAVSGTLALMQDYFTNHTAQTLPSPALMKALVINGSRSQGSYEFAVTNDINLQGWGLPSLPAILPFGLSNQISAPCTTFFLDQNPTNALATGQSQTFIVNIPDFTTEIFPLRVTLAWTDPPGNPAAAIKLVNSLELVVTNLDSTSADFGKVYFGNDLDGGTNSEAWITNTTPNIDLVNNVQNVFLPALLGKSYSVTVIGRSVNVNAVTAQTNNAAGVYAPNVVQDYALVISSGGDGQVTNGITVLPQPSPNPFVGPQVTFVGTTNALLINQLAGGNTPLMGTNTVGAGAGYITNAAITVGMTNQWHFYVVGNPLGFTNAAFITFLSQTLATPRMGVFADTTQNPTQPDADIDLYVAGPADPLASSLTNLNPIVLSNCVHGINGDGASLANSTGTEFVAYTNSQPDDVYYIAVKSETQVAAEYDFLPVFSLFPFSTTDANGNETVNGLLVPVNIPDGSNAHPGTAYIFALAVQPVQIQNVIVTNTFLSQNFGDLVGVLQHSGASVVLNNHNSPPPTIPPDIFDFIYDDSPQPSIGSQPPDGPGSLKSFQGQQGIGPWILTEVDNSLTQTSSVTGLTLFVEPHISLTGGGQDIALQPMSFFYGFVDVPAGATNLTIAATNITVIPDLTAPGQLFEKLNEQPAPPPTPPTNFDKMVILDNPGPFGPNGVITVGPSDLPPIEQGRYFVTLYNPSAFPQNYHVTASIALGQVTSVDFGGGGTTNLLDDAVTYSSVFVTNTLPIATIGVGLRVDHPRISDLVFHLISPDGTRYLLMENRGADSTNGCGLTVVSTNDFPPVSSSGGPEPQTNIVNVNQTFGTVAIDYNFFPQPDEMSVFYQGAKIFDSGLISNSGTFNISYGPGTSTDLTIIMNEFTNSAPTTTWNYTIHSIQTNYYYLTLTDDTNLATTPIKFAPPPFVPVLVSAPSSPDLAVWQNGFEGNVPGNYVGISYISDGWLIDSGDVDIVNTGAYEGNNYLDLDGWNPGEISTNIVTVSGTVYSLNFAYARNPDSITGAGGFPIHVPTAGISINGNSLATVSANYINSWADLNWQLTNYIFTATSSLTHLDFKSLDALPAASGLFLDAISVTKSLIVMQDGFDNSPGGTYFASGFIPGSGWQVTAGSIDVLDPADTFPTFTADSLVSCLDLNGVSAGTIATNFNTTVGQQYVLSFAYTKSADIAAPPGFVAKMNLSLTGVPTFEIDDSSPNDYLNLNWAHTSIVFTATSPTTTLSLASLNSGPDGMFLDSFRVSATNEISSSSNLYYFPEQSLDPLIGTSAFGTWQLEIQDDRVGATNHAVLDSWQLQIAFAQTNPVPANIGGGVTNFIPPGGLAWYEVDVPTNADFATNILTFATGPLNMWYSTNVPPTITNPPGDVELLAGATSGSRLLGTTGYPDIVPGGFDFIGIQNPGGVTIQYGFRVDFHLLGFGGPLPFAFTEPATLVDGTSAQLNGMATPNGLPATAWFEWGTSQAYGNTTPPVGVGTNFNVVFVSTNITGLVTNFAFHYRLVVSNLVGVTYGFDQVFDQGSLVAWGADFNGQTTPLPAGPTNLVVGVGAGYDYSLALNYDGTVVAWGDNLQGQTNVPAGLSNAVAVAGGVVDSLALRSDQTVKVWGSNTYGQTNVPPDLTNAVAAASGSYHCLALRSNGNPVTWGSNDGTNMPAGLSNVVAVAAGQAHSLALKNDGTVVAWGNNASGQTNVPPGLTNVVAIAAGYSHNLALKSDGTVAAWGFNGNGQTNVPFGLTNVMAIAAGGYHCLALRTDGTVVFWGDSGAGQTNFYPANLTNVFTIAGGGFHTVGVSALYGLSVTNTPPYWTNGLNSTTVTMGVLTTKVINNAALDNNAPPQLVFYSFVNNPPPFASIDAFTGIITLSPLATDGPSTNTITTVATDNGYPPLSATNRFTLIVTSTNPPPQTNTVPISGIIYTNIGGTNGFLLTWFAPSNDLFQVQWTTSLFPAVWTTFTNPPAVSYNTNFPAGPASAQFNFFDDGTQTGGFGPTRFYRLILLGAGPSANTPPVLPPQTTRTINPLNPLVVTNTATDADLPPQTLTYAVSSTVTGTNVPTINISTGVITWTPDVSQAGTSNVITTVVTDNGVPPLSATNSFSVIVNPVPGISSVTFSNGGFLLTWFAPTNDIFQVQVATNLALPTVWQTIATNVTYTGPATPTNGLFSYFDDGSQVPFGSLRFYRLQLVGITPSATATVPIGSILSTNGGFLLTWLAPTNDQFNVRWSTNLVPPVAWTPFPDLITSTNGVFSFTDTNAPSLLKFYELILLP